MSSIPFSTPRLLGRVLRAAQVALAVVSAALLAWLSLASNFERACTTADTPYLDLCPKVSPGSEQHLAGLRARIARNPGDANAHVQLAQYDRSKTRAQSIDMASKLAPTEPNVLMMQAVAALEAGNWPLALRPLIALSEFRSDPQASLALARLIGAGKGKALAEHLSPGSRWFPRVLAQMATAGVPFSTALPLVVTALQNGVLEPAAAKTYIRQLKGAAAWADAYSLWLALHRQQLPVLYNGDFDQSFESDGFDWELSGQNATPRPGVIFDRPNLGKRGGVLEIRLTGRRMPVPLIRQYLFLGEGRYRIQGEYNASQLRLEQGLAWTVRCTAAAVEAGRSAALKDTGGKWQGFELDFIVPQSCGQVVSLQLETYAAFEAEAGGQGRFAFDALKLARKAN